MEPRTTGSTSKVDSIDSAEANAAHKTKTPPFRFCTWIANVLNKIRNLLSMIPLFGRLFAINQPPVQKTQAPVKNTPKKEISESKNYDNWFDTQTSKFIDELNEENEDQSLDKLLKDFADIKEPRHKKHAFANMILSEKSTEAIARLFYVALDLI